MDKAQIRDWGEPIVWRDAPVIQYTVEINDKSVAYCVKKEYAELLAKAINENH